MSDPSPPRPPVPPPPYQTYVAPAGYTPPGQRVAAYGGPLPPPHRKTQTLGLVALIASLVALAVSTITVSVAAYRIGLGTGQQLAGRQIDAAFDWSILAPVREWVLVGEISFWAGAILGVWALIQGIVATVAGRGRAFGIAAIAVALFAPVAFAIALNVFLSIGFAAASIAGA